MNVLPYQNFQPSYPSTNAVNDKLPACFNIYSQQDGTVIGQLSLKNGDRISIMQYDGIEKNLVFSCYDDGTKPVMLFGYEISGDYASAAKTMIVLDNIDEISLIPSHIPENETLMDTAENSHLTALPILTSPSSSMASPQDTVLSSYSISDLLESKQETQPSPTLPSWLPRKINHLKRPTNELIIEENPSNESYLVYGAQHAKLNEWAASGNYVGERPQHFALIRWVILRQRGKFSEADKLLETIQPYFGCIRFYPKDEKEHSVELRDRLVCVSAPSHVGKRIFELYQKICIRLRNHDRAQAELIAMQSAASSQSSSAQSSDQVSSAPTSSSDAAASSPKAPTSSSLDDDFIDPAEIPSDSSQNLRVSSDAASVSKAPTSSSSEETPKDPLTCLRAPSQKGQSLTNQLREHLKPIEISALNLFLTLTQTRKSSGAGPSEAELKIKKTYHDYISARKLLIRNSLRGIREKSCPQYILDSALEFEKHYDVKDHVLAEVTRMECPEGIKRIIKDAYGKRVKAPSVAAIPNPVSQPKNDILNEAELAEQQKEQAVTRELLRRLRPLLALRVLTTKEIDCLLDPVKFLNQEIPIPEYLVSIIKEALGTAVKQISLSMMLDNGQLHKPKEIADWIKTEASESIGTPRISSSPARTMWDKLLFAFLQTQRGLLFLPGERRPQVSDYPWGQLGSDELPITRSQQTDSKSKQIREWIVPIWDSLLYRYAHTKIPVEIVSALNEIIDGFITELPTATKPKAPYVPDHKLTREEFDKRVLNKELKALKLTIQMQAVEFRGLFSYLHRVAAIEAAQFLHDELQSSTGSYFAECFNLAPVVELFRHLKPHEKETKPIFKDLMYYFAGRSLDSKVINCEVDIHGEPMESEITRIGAAQQPCVPKRFDDFCFWDDTNHRRIGVLEQYGRVIANDLIKIAVICKQENFELNWEELVDKTVTSIITMMIDSKLNERDFYIKQREKIGLALTQLVFYLDRLSPELRLATLERIQATPQVNAEGHAHFIESYMPWLQDGHAQSIPQQEIKMRLKNNERIFEHILYFTSRLNNNQREIIFSAMKESAKTHPELYQGEKHQDLIEWLRLNSVIKSGKLSIKELPDNLNGWRDYSDTAKYVFKNENGFNDGFFPLITCRDVIEKPKPAKKPGDGRSVAFAAAAASTDLD